jgi:hypothetical protein
MSLDYPDYEELQKKSKLLCVVWRVGDMGIYAGLFGTIGVPLWLIIEYFISRKNQVPFGKMLLFAALTTSIFICMSIGSASLKYFAVRVGKKLKRKY